jgi:uncharacterized protein (TIGR03437 family)
MRSTARSLFFLLLVAIPALGQVTNVRVSMSPGDGIPFTVDGQTFQGSASFLWPQGSKHTLTVQSIEVGNTPKTQYGFTGWTSTAGSLVGTWNATTLIVTADPQLQSVVAAFNTFYEFDLIFYTCPPDANPCPSPAQISVVGSAPSGPGPLITNQSYSAYVPAGTSIGLTVQPNPGYIFTGWLSTPGNGNSAQTFFNEYPVNAPLSVYPQFMLSRPIGITLTTSPTSLQILADHTPISTPVNLDWGTGTVHTLSVVSPQVDLNGNTWVFSSWSDGGALNHSYTVPQGYNAIALSATFLPAHRITFATNPVGLPLSINGRTNWPSLTFTGAAGTQYQVSAPAMQLDAQGRINQFVSWSNGGAATQTYIQPGSDDHLTATYQTLGHLALLSSPPGLSFTVNGQACVSPCEFDQAPGMQMNISAPASISLSSASRLDFQGWQDSSAATRTYTMTAAVQTLTASYQTKYLVASGVTPPTGGSVVLQPASPDGFYPAYTQLQASVSPNPGFQFRSWQGDAAGSQSMVMINVTNPKMIGATLGPVPYLPPAAVQNAAGATPVNGVAPGSVVSIYGLNLSSNTLAGPTSPLSQALLNITAMLGNQILPLYFVSPQQINVQLPFESSLGAQALVLRQQGQPDVSAVFAVVRNAPGIFGIGHSDGSAVTADSPAAAGETLTITGTGFGPYDRNPPDGLLIPGDSTFALIDPVSVTAGGVAATVLSFGPSYDGVGLNVATFQVPTTLPSGTSVPLNVTVNGADSNQLSLFLQ